MTFSFWQGIAVICEQWDHMTLLQPLIIIFLTTYYRPILLLLLAQKVPLIVWQLWCGSNLRFRTSANLTQEAPWASLMEAKQESINTGVGRSTSNSAIVVWIKYTLHPVQGDSFWTCILHKQRCKDVASIKVDFSVSWDFTVLKRKTSNFQ